MDELTGRALARPPLSAEDVRIVYSVSGKSATRTLCESHERLRAELEGMDALLRDAEAEVLRYQRALEELAAGVVADPVAGRLEPMPADMVRLIAREALAGSRPRY